MIIDSHSHYTHSRFDGEFPYLCNVNSVYSVNRADREALFNEMKINGIEGCIEVAITLDGIEKIASLSSRYESFLGMTVGVHPTRCIHTEWKKRKKLDEYSASLSPVAIGETGLDYHHQRKDQHRLRQRRWFLYQLRLADKLDLPLVLHIRNADRDALKILKKHRSRLHGGVVHCFSSSYETASEYIELGFSIGIGGKLLVDDEIGKTLCETIKKIPLSSIIIETDSPYVLPDTTNLECSKNQQKKLCNSSLILPSVLRKISELRGESYETVENTVYQNTVRLFRLTSSKER